LEGEICLFTQPNIGNTQNPQQLALYYIALAEYFERLKLAAVNQPTLFNQYQEQQLYYTALANHYNSISAGEMKPYTIKIEATGNVLNNGSLLNSLREGGYILYARHGEATVGEDQPYLNFYYCSTQRNLSAIGRKQAVTYGNVIRNLNIPVFYPIITSPFCRNIETADLAFGVSNIQVDPFWVEVYNLGRALSPAEQARVINQLISFLEVQPPPGSNKVVIAHSFPPGIALGPISNMGTVVIKPRGHGNGFEVVGQISLTKFTSLDV
jgi:hypothetical protein